MKCTYCDKYRHTEDKCWFETSQSQAGTPQEKAPPHSLPPKKRTRDESIEREEENKASYLAVDEARYFVAFHNTDLASISYVAESTSLLYTPATKDDFALDTACSQHASHNRDVFTSYQDLSYPQKIKRYAGSLQAKGMGKVVLQ